MKLFKDKLPFFAQHPVCSDSPSVWCGLLVLQEVCIPSAGVLALPACPEGAALRPQA